MWPLRSDYCPSGREDVVVGGLVLSQGTQSTWAYIHGARPTVITPRMDEMSHGRERLVNESNLCGRVAQLYHRAAVDELRGQKHGNEREVVRDPHGCWPNFS